MPARTGQEYIDRLAAAQITVDIHGERRTGAVTETSAFKNVIQTYAALYDMQHDEGLRDELTYESPSTGDPVGVSFLQPANAEDLARRRRMMQVWAEWSNGLLGRTGDYLNAAVMAMAGAADWFAQADPKFGENIRNYYEYVRENDLLLTHTLIMPQANRAATVSNQRDPFLAARIVEENDSGVVLRGARMLATIGPIADELLVMPSTVLRGGADDAPYSFALAVPCDAPGLRFLCRESFDLDRSHFDHPLGSRFEEIDAVVVFDDVLVPFERCFALRDPELCNGIYSETSAAAHMTHQVVTRTTAKTEYMLGLVSLLTEAIGIEGFQHVQEKVAEVIIAVEIVKALLRAAEADAEENAYGIFTPAWAPLNACRNWYPRVSQRFPEILRQLGSSGLMALPTEADAFGSAREDVERFLQGAAIDGIDRVRLFRLAWDTCLSAFAGRQTLYEYFFFGDPVRMAGALVSTYDREPYKERVRAFLARDQAPQPLLTAQPTAVPLA
jgi:4-hydroxyphenylacetate 3-monooxygenase